MSMVGVFIKTQIRNQDDGITKLSPQAMKRHLHNPLGIRGTRTDGVFVRWHPKERDRRDANFNEVHHLGDQRINGVLDMARQRVNGPWRGQPFCHKQRSNKICCGQARLCNEPAKGGRASKPTRSRQKGIHEFSA